MLIQSAYAITDGSFPGSPLQRATRLLEPSAAVRIAARLRRGMLDRALTNGADPAASRLIAARAAQLASASMRARVADGLERLALSADSPRSRVRILPSRAAMLGNRSELLELAGLLRRDRPLYARGVAMLEVILTDGASPAYTDRRGEALARQLQIARAGLTS
jgi:hypothetical protein